MRKRSDELKCQACQLSKPRDSFYTNLANGTGRATICKDCNSDETRLGEYRRLVRRRGEEALIAKMTRYSQLLALMGKALEENRAKRKG